MQKMLLIVAIMLISSCSVFVADHIGGKKQEVNDRVFCAENPDQCTDIEEQ